MAQDDSALKRTKKKWSVQHDAEKDVATIEKIRKLPRRQLFFLHVDTQTQLMASENLSPLAYMYIYIYIYIHISTINHRILAGTPRSTTIIEAKKEAFGQGMGGGRLQSDIFPLFEVEIVI